MTTRFHIGARELRGGLAAYAKRFDFLEVTVGPAAGSTAEVLRTNPGLTTLRKWRRDVPPHFDFAVVAGSALSSLKPGDALEHDLTAARAAIDALRARCFVLRTPPSVTPAQVWRDRMTRLVERLPMDATHVVWEPSGVWELEEAVRVARKWGVTVAVDAARDAVPQGPLAYARLRALGETRSFGTAALERVVVAIGERRDAYVILETESALAECKRLRQVAQSMSRGPKGGLGRVLRPKGGLAVRDDEQE